MSEVRAETLVRIGIFSALDADARARIARRCHSRRYEAGQAIVHGEDTSRDVYFVLHGRVRAAIFSRSGKEVAFRDLGSGEAFGDLAAIDGRPRSASVAAIEESVIVSMSAAAFWEVLEAHPQVAAAVMRELTAIIRRLSERVVEFSTLGVNNRIHAELLRLAREGEVDGNRARIAPAPTHAEIASRVSTHREAVSRELTRLARAGIVAREDGALRVDDLARLQAMVDEVKRG